jgi:large subunit ribosomal protein L4
MEDKTKNMAKFLNKIEASGNVLCVVSKKDPSKERAAQNIPNLKVSAAVYLNVYNILNADSIVMSQKALAIVTEWLGVKPARPGKEAE